MTLGITHLVHPKNFPKTNISYPLIQTRTCAYQRVGNVGFSGIFANLLMHHFLNDTLLREMVVKMHTKKIEMWPLVQT